MERGVYFDGWLPREHCYHPSMPQRHLRILDDLERYHATVLTWAGMGGGSISLPYLHHEAFGPVDPRIRDSFWAPHELTGGVQRYDHGNDVYVHILNYRYDAGTDRVSPADSLRLRVKGLAGVTPEVIVPSWEKAPVCSALTDGGDALVTLNGAGLYTILHYTKK